MIKLNLPDISNQIQVDGTKLSIFDPIRKKYILLTPEEWVRQHLINLFIAHLKYPSGLIKIESGLTYNKKLKRSDIQVYDRKGKLFLLCECKAPEVKIDQKTLHQAMAYAKVLNPCFLLLSNGLNHFSFERDPETLIWKNTDDFPSLPEL
jgi:hypothetical protein